MDAEVVENAVRKIFEEERTAFWVPAEPHYNDHKFVQVLRKVLIAIGAVVMAALVPTLLYIIIEHFPTQARGESNESISDQVVTTVRDGRIDRSVEGTGQEHDQ